MAAYAFSRRTFLAAAGVGTAALLSGCDIATVPTVLVAPTDTPNPSPNLAGPYLRAPFSIDRIILGDYPGTQGLPQPLPPAAGLPASVKVVVYHPRLHGTDHRVPTPNPLGLPKGPFPVVLYAHALRGGIFGGVGAHPAEQDFTSVGTVLSHVASYGCICVAPDLSWMPDSVTMRQMFDQRGNVLVQLYAYLASLNATLFAGQLDLSRVVLAGHSTGAGGATHAGRIIAGFSHPKALCYGLIAPLSGGDSAADIHNLLVLGGTVDIDQGADPGGAYAAGGTSKTLVTIPGANHFGYTDICPPNNACNSAGLFDENGTIPRDAQQQTAAAYLSALMLYHVQGDARMRAYLMGARMVEGLDALGATGLQVQAQGYPILPPGGPTIGPAQP